MKADLPPQDLMAEASIISAVLNGFAAPGDVLAVVQPEDFYRTGHQVIMTAINDLHGRGEPVDLVTIASHLKANGQLKAAGGSDYLARILEDCPVSADHLHHAQIVKAAATSRTLIENCNAAIRAAFEGKDPAAVLAPLRSNLERLQSACEPAGREVFRFVPASDLKARPIDWLIHGIVERDTLCLMFGDSGSYKSFCAIDMACACAAGRPWQGIPIFHSGPVAYICGEGRGGISRRIMANCIRNYRDMDSLPVFVSTLPAGLSDSAQLAAVKAAADSIAEQHGAPAMIIIDTLARNFGPGDENKTQDMNAFIAALDALRLAYGAAIVVVHHTGHVNKDRGRGAVSLHAAVDSEYRFDRDQDSGITRMVCTKMKDSSPPAPMAFRPAVVELGIEDEHGRPVTSLVLDGIDYEPPKPTGHEGKGKWQRVAIETLQSLFDERRSNLQVGGYSGSSARVSVEDWRVACQDQGMNREAWRRIKSNPPAGIIIKHGFAEMPEDAMSCHV